MNIPLARRAVLLSPLGAAIAASFGTARASGQPSVSPQWPAFPKTELELAREIVGASHGNEARVRELAEAHPALVNASWDWGFGDWETPLGAAAHTGRRAIAEFLIERGARVDIFAAAMLGWTDAVRAMLSGAPGAARAPGPHGITLFAHARAGGDASASTLELLKSTPGADEGPKTISLTAAELGVYTGRYAQGERTFEIKIDRERLAFAMTGHATRFLSPVGDHAFFPAGASAVRFRFSEDGGARKVVITDHDLRVDAVRTG